MIKYFTKERPSVISTSDGILPTTSAFYGPWESQAQFLEWFSSVSDVESLPSGASVGIRLSDGTVEDYRIQNPSGAKPYFEKAIVGKVSSDIVVMSNGSTTLTEAWESMVSASVNITGAVYFNTVADLKASTILRAGDVAITKGFYSKDDGGGAVYNIISTPSDISTYPANEFNLFFLANGLYADIAISGNRVSFLQVGGRPHSKVALGNQPTLTFNNNDPLDNLTYLGGKRVYDNKEALEAYTTLCKRKGEGIVLEVPAGHYFTSPAFLGSSSRGVMISGVHEQGDEQNMASFHAIRKMQDYIWSVSGQRVLNNRNYTQYGPSNIRITNICFDGAIGGRDTYDYKIMPKVALVCVGANMSYFDGIFLRSLLGGIVIGNTQETHFGLINVRGVGGFYKGEILNPIRFIYTGGSYSSSRFSVKVWGVSEEDYVAFSTTRNCSALYFDYFNCEGVFGSVMHAEIGANFTHGEINNVQWEATMKNISPPNSADYPGLMDFRYNPSGENFGWRIGESAALSNTPTSYTYTKEKIIRCGFVSGDLYDIVIHCVTVTWGTDGQIWGYNGTLYRVAQSAVVVMGSPTAEASDSITSQYGNVTLITYNFRQSFRALYMGISNSTKYTADYPFSCCRPVDPSTTDFVVRAYCPAPKINFTKQLPPNKLYCALLNTSGSDMGCMYDSAIDTPAHLVRCGYAFSFRYDSSKHYRACLRASQSPVKVKVYSGSTEYGTLSVNNPTAGTTDYIVVNLDLESLNIPHNKNISTTIEQGSWRWAWLELMDRALVYSDTAPAIGWVGRAYMNSSGTLFTCTRGTVVNQTTEATITSALWSQPSGS